MKKKTNRIRIKAVQWYAKPAENQLVIEAVDWVAK